MSRLRGFRDRMTSFFLGTSREGKPIIQTQYGPVSEEARFAAAMNMRLDPALRLRVEALLIKQYGSRERGLAECKRRYKEAYDG